MIKEIKNLIDDAGMVSLDELHPFQPDNLKIMTTESFQKLKNSIVENDFVTGFVVWKDKDKLWIIDGHHRKYALEQLKKEGAILPAKYACLYLGLKDKKHANKILLTYSSNHARLHPEGFLEFVHAIGMDMDILKETLDIPGIDIDRLDGDIEDMEPDAAGEENKKIITIDCKDEATQQKLYEELKGRGYDCKLKL